VETLAVIRWTLCLAGLLSVTPVSAADKPAYNRDIRPILAEHCFACHGPDSAARKADLRIDRRDDAVAAQAINPDRLGESELLRRIFSTDPDEVMPPPDAHKELQPEQKELLKRWVEAGAEYEPHWSLIAPQRPDLPAVKQSNWVRNPIDRFVLARLEAEGLTPAPEADKRTLARRVCLDLTGVPPAPELVEAFVHDPSPNAYETLVDKLLESPQWGEHRGRYWLDAARYADTHGIHFDNYREIWAYRDWVIDAFNRNLPFDQFTIEQLAGDLLPDATLDQKIASGFNRCNMTTNEGGIIDEEYAVLYARERTETVSAVWMGLTAGCAVCHDHKFDPLTMRDFYSLSAFFNNTTQNVRDGNIKDTPPILQVPKAEDRPRWRQLQTDIAATKKDVDERQQQARGDFEAWLAKATPATLENSNSAEGLILKAAFNEGQGTSAKIQIDGQDRDVALAETPAWQ
jgi:mono/diheme cytochrome c family protein